MRDLIAVVVCSALLVAASSPALSVTPPRDGAVSKAADFVIVPPWAEGTHEVSCAYGCGMHDGTASAGGTNDEYALDFAMATGDAVHPVAPGTVVYAGPGLSGATTGWTRYGNMVYVQHDERYSSLYAHLDSVDVTTGQPVTPETRLGGAGESGTEGGVHLHFALYHGAQHDSRGMPYGGVSVVPEPFAECIGDCADLVAGSQLTRAPATDSTATTAPPVQWVEPADGAKVGPGLQLSAWPTPVLVDGQLIDPTDVAGVDFTASWPGGSAPACSATAADAENLWSCTADLVAMGVPAGPVEFSFDVVRTDGSTLSAPDGMEAVTYVAPPTDPMRYLRAGIPAAIRSTCTKRTTELPPGTIAAVDCRPDASAIDAMAYYLLRPDDARSVWQERTGEYALTPGGDCAKGRAGIQSKGPALSVGCYKNEYGYANLRLATSTTCPAVYWALLGNTKDIAKLWTAYDRIAGEGWMDPGLGGRKDAPGCSGKAKGGAPPTAPSNGRLGPGSRPTGCRDGGCGWPIGHWDMTKIRDAGGKWIGVAWTVTFEVTWVDRSRFEKGYHIYRRPVYQNCRDGGYDVIGRPILMATVPADREGWSGQFTFRIIDNQPRRSDPHQWQILVTAFNEGGESGAVVAQAASRFAGVETMLGFPDACPGVTP